MKKLLLDLGNSAIKWCVQDEHGQLSEVVSHPHQNDPQSVEFALEQAQLDFDSLSRACLCNVASPELELAVLHFLQPRTRVHIAQVTEETLGVSCGYEDLSRFGVDRWVCLVAARQLYPDQPRLVVDIGTAVTLDAMTASGQHLGGQILPGIEMMQYSLGRGTAQVGYISTDPAAPPWFGCTTQQGVDSGTRYAVASLIEAAWKELTRSEGDDTALILTGGGLEMIKPLIHVTMHCEPTLIFQGLGLIVDTQ